MKKSVLINGNLIEYELVIKKVKNINLRIRNDGKITVSANKRVDVKLIEDFMIKKSDFIINALEKFSLSSCDMYSTRLCDGDFLLLLGDRYEIKNEVASRNFINITDDKKALIFTKDQSLESKEKALLNLYGKTCEEKLILLCREVYNEFKDKVSSMPQIKFRKTKNRWGTCYSKQNKIILNKLLAVVPIDCVKYVIYHEFTHFIYPDHSKKFYNELEKYVPNHKALKKKLNSYAQFL